MSDSSMSWFRKKTFHESGKALALPVCLLALLTLALPGQAIESRKVEKMIEGAQPREVQAFMAREREKILNRGRSVFQKFCIHCHGERGKGDGAATPYLTPLPRDLSSGIFKFHSTKNIALPLDRDLARTIEKGIPGTVMPAWGEILGPEAIHSLVQYLKTFSDRFGQEIPDSKITIEPEPPFDRLSVQQGKILFRQMRCGHCHGDDGQRAGPLEDSMKDVWGHTSFVYDLQQPGLYKAGAASEEIFQTLSVGMDGTPMTTYDYLTVDERWHLVHYLQSLFASAPPVPTRRSLVSLATDQPLAVDADHPAWQTAPALTVRLAPIRFRKHPIQEVTVQAIHNQKQIAFRMQWADPSPEGAAISDFPDEAAIQFALGHQTVAQGPFYGMGERQKPVNIWHWKADANQPIFTTPSNNSATGHPVPPVRKFLNPFNESPVEELNASGFGTLQVQPLVYQHLEGRGQWRAGQWTVVFLRDLETHSPNDINFKSGGRFLLAFAVWDGANRDKNANKVVSFWQSLTLDADE